MKTRISFHISCAQNPLLCKSQIIQNSRREVTMDKRYKNVQFTEETQKTNNQINNVSVLLLSIKECSWVQFSHSVVSNSLQHNELQVSLSITKSRSLVKLMSIELVMPSNHLTLCHPLLLLPSIIPSIRIFSNESLRIRWPKYWSFSFSISPSNKYSELISFRMDWLDLPWTLKSLPNTTVKKHQFFGVSFSWSTVDL